MPAPPPTEHGLAVVPDAMLDEGVWKFPATQAALVVKITPSSSAETDRVQKPCGYALGEVPAYLLIDTGTRHITLFEEPAAGVYRRQAQVEFGAKLELAAPFTAALDTSVLLRRSAEPSSGPHRGVQ